MEVVGESIIATEVVVEVLEQNVPAVEALEESMTAVDVEVEGVLEESMDCMLAAQMAVMQFGSVAAVEALEGALEVEPADWRHPLPSQGPRRERLDTALTWQKMISKSKISHSLHRYII